MKRLFLRVFHPASEIKDERFVECPLEPGFQEGVVDKTNQPPAWERCLTCPNQAGFDKMTNGMEVGVECNFRKEEL
jgi:hypothetical protein